MIRSLYYALWIAPVLVFVCLAAMMLRRKLHKQMPKFFAFVVFQFASFGVAFYTYHRSQLDYFYAYWVLSAIGISLAFGVLYEVFTGLFRPFVGLRELGNVLFRWAALVLIVAAALLVTASTPLPGSRIFSTILNLARGLEVMQCGLVLLMLLCSGYLGLTLKHRIFGVALGFGIIAAVDLIAVTFLTSLGEQAATFVKLSKLVAENLSAVLWLGYVYAGQVECKPTRQVAYAERWDFALATALHPGEDSPALPLIENVVERVWKKTNGHTAPHPAPPRGADQ